MKPFTFVHAADLHLGSPFKGVTARIPRLLDVIQNATMETFHRLISLCQDVDAQFLLIAGDVIDNADQNLRSQLAFRDGVTTLAVNGIQTLVVHGNHDPKTSWSSRICFPQGVYFFGSTAVETRILTVNETPSVSVSGISYENRHEHRRLVSKFTVETADLFKIGLLHTSCGPASDHAVYAPATVSELRDIGMDYWALGHVHERAILSTAPPVVYPGNTQGLSIRETGPRGCFVVSVDEAGRPTPSFQAIDTLRWLTATVDVTSIRSVDGLEEALGLKIEALRREADGRPAIARITITGRTSLYAVLRGTDAAETILDRARTMGMQQDPPLWLEDLRLDCSPEIELHRRRSVDDFLGQVLREAQSLRENAYVDTGEPGVLPEAFRTALEEIFHHRPSTRFLDPLTPVDCERLLIEAERLCIDLLESDL